MGGKYNERLIVSTLRRARSLDGAFRYLRTLEGYEDIARQTVWYYVKKGGLIGILNKPLQSTPVDSKEEGYILSLYGEYNGVADHIAEACGRSSNTVLRILRKHGRKIRKSGLRSDADPKKKLIKQSK
jgi:hypothetical protein